jgi:hypothetical protein
MKVIYSFLSLAILIFRKILDRVRLWGLHSKLKKDEIMILPQNGSIIVIDDKPNQALPIVKALSKTGIATTYYTGREHELPEKPVQNVRLAIVDLHLWEGTNDTHTIITNLINTLQRLISKENGPYILMIWSIRDQLYSQEFKEEINKRENNLVPACIITLNKSDCLKRVDKEPFNDFLDSILTDIENRFEENDLNYIRNIIEKHWIIEDDYEAKSDAIQIIEGNLKSELEKAGVFHLFIIWENLVRKAGAQTVNAISSTIEYNELWEINMRDVLKRMGWARTGKNTLPDNLFLNAALATFSSSFSDELDFEIRKLKYPNYIKLESPFSIAGILNGDTYKIVIYSDGNNHKVKLLKNDEMYNGKVGIRIDNISKLSEDLEGSEKLLIDNLIKQYQNIPFIVNTKLHLELEPSDGHMPGNVYKIDLLPERKKELLPTYLQNIPEDVTNYHFVELEVSPICDYAQNKWKKSRLISGLLFPPFSIKNLKSGPFYKNSPDIVLNGEKYSLIFNYLFFKALDISYVEERGGAWFRIKRELLQDIINGLTGHVGRSGVTKME